MVLPYSPCRGKRLSVDILARVLLTLALTGLIIPALAQTQDYTADSLFIVIFSDGDALIEYDLDIISPGPDTSVMLFGETINDLIVVDYNDNLVDHVLGSSPGEIIVDTSNVENVRINYETPDLVDKVDRVWTFSLNSSIGFAMKLPPDSVVIDWGEPSPTVKLVGEQTLLTFKPGDIKVSYIIGFLGTEDQANAAIKSAENTIMEIDSKYPDIILINAETLLQRAILAKDDGKYADAEKLAAQANDLAFNTGKEYAAAQTALTNADEQIKAAASQNRDTGSARSMLAQANAEFSRGEYTLAKNSAEDAIAAIGKPPPAPSIPTYAIVAAAIAGAAAAAVFVIKRRRPTAIPAARPRPPNSTIPREPEIKADEIGGSAISNLQAELDSSAQPVEGSSIIPESKIDQSVLSKIVARILAEKPHLRPEDQHVLKFLAEKEGAAFESEIRTKFQLPKTTIWRLVKRLEREELVEIRKAGGQNLIKLRFENRQP